MRKLGLLLVAGVMATFSMQAFAATQAVNRPLLVVRFNQPNVYFERALKQAVTSAESAKSGVIYDVVSYVPNERFSDANAREAANYNLNTVATFIQQLGVPASRLNITSQASGTVTSQEVQVFVR